MVYMRSKILYSDVHVGVALAQAATIRKAGADCKVLSADPALARFAPDEVQAVSQDEQEIITNMRLLWLNHHPRAKRPFVERLVSRIKRTIDFRPSFKKKTRSWWYGCSWTSKKTDKLLQIVGEETMHRIYSPYDTYWVSFPPSLAHLFLELAEKYDKRIVLNLGQRFSIGIRTREENRAMAALLEHLHRHPRHILAAGDEYECKYVEYYLGFRPKKLPFVCHHLELKLPLPDLETILIGPVSFRIKAVEEMLNVSARDYCRRKGHVKSIQFALIGSLYKVFEYEDLAHHPAIVIFPYSTYSINMLELYELNIPFFVPSRDILLKYQATYPRILNDRALYPCYCTREQYTKMALPPKSDIPYSPDSYDEDAQRYWLQFCFFYRTKNAIIWDSEEDLMEKLLTTDLEQVRRNMYEENKVKREMALREYKAIIDAN